jgi:hypothetical protein
VKELYVFFYMTTMKFVNYKSKSCCWNNIFFEFAFIEGFQETFIPAFETCKKVGFAVNKRLQPFTCRTFQKKMVSVLSWVVT